MKLLLTTLALALITACMWGQDGNDLFPIRHGNLWGYINKSGTVVIEPPFYVAGDFSEGLAAVRLEGTYGYIDVAGEFVIAPQYDLAFSFNNGLAQVFTAGKPLFIDRCGTIEFQNEFKSIASFAKRRVTVATTHSGKMGLIDRSGSLVADTVFSRIQLFDEGIAVVHGQNHTPYPSEPKRAPVYEVGVIDTLGNWVVQYGKYKDIGRCIGGFMLAVLITSERDDGQQVASVVIDKHGAKRFACSLNKFEFSYQGPEYFDDVAIVHAKHVGVLDTNGKVLYVNPDWTKITRYSYNRAFAMDETYSWVLIDKLGNRIGTNSYKKVVFEENRRGIPTCPFIDGIAFVTIDGLWCTIDTSGKILSKINTKLGLSDFESQRVGSMLLLTKMVPYGENNCAFFSCLYIPQTNAFIPPNFDHINIRTPDEALISATKNGLMYYLTTTGKVIWKEDASVRESVFLNIDFMSRASYAAACTYPSSQRHMEKRSGTRNHSQPITTEPHIESGALQLVVYPQTPTVWESVYRGMKMVIANTSSDTVFFNAQDGDIAMNLQALNSLGQWVDIEYVPNSWCGNSYHTVFLAPNELWDYNIPAFQGAIKTRIRTQLKYTKSFDQQVPDVLYSNEIDGHVNPGQFWNKRHYTPAGIMDPYIE